MKKSLRILPLALLAIVALTIASCDLFLTLLASPTLTVVDARSGSGLDGVTVSLTPIAVQEGKVSKTITGTSGSNGVVTFLEEVAYGDYTVTGIKTGYVFVSFNATVAGWSTNLGKLFGISGTKGDQANAVSIFLTWNTAKDIDAYLTYPTTFIAPQATPATPRTYSAYYDIASAGETRRKVFWNDKDGSGTTADDTTAFAYLDVDKNAINGGFGPETVTLLGDKTGYSSLSPLTAVTSSTAYIGSVLPPGNYVYMGDAVYYLDGYETGSTSHDMSDDGVRVVVTQGASVKGIFSIPTDIAMKTGSVLRISLFYSVVSGALDEYYFVFMPDSRILSDRTGIKALDDTIQPVVVSGKK